MKISRLRNSILIGLSGLVLISTTQAATPVWTFSPVPGFPNTVTLNSTGTATVKYTVMNQSHKPHTLEMIPIQGITPSGCTAPLEYLQSCTLSLEVSGSALTSDVIGGPVLCDHGNHLECYQPSLNYSLAVHFEHYTLMPSVSTLALSINSPLVNAALTGNPRQITIENTGSVNATNVSVNTSGLPLGTSISSNTCTGTLDAGASCIITVTPGAVASSDLSSSACTTAGTQPVAGTITISADGGLSSQVNAYVLGYGCQYQGGFIYSVDDTTPNTGSIGGKVASLIDLARPSLHASSPVASIIWGSNGNGSVGADVNYTAILGTDETSTTLAPSPTIPAYPGGTPAFTHCNGSSDGSCNSSNILSYYNANRVAGGSAPTPLTDYAAGLCTATINNYSDWYLPSICEMDTVFGTVTCPAGTQSWVVNLSFLIGDPVSLTPSTSCSPPSGTSCLAGYYWSSTEYSFGPALSEWFEYFATSGGSYQGSSNKAGLQGVRCSRALTL